MGSKFLEMTNEHKRRFSDDVDQSESEQDEEDISSQLNQA